MSEKNKIEAKNERERFGNKDGDWT